MSELSQSGFAASRQEKLPLTINNIDVLHQSYMSFVKRGGLFVPTHRSYRLGDKVLVELTLMDEPETFLIAGKVIWVTPPGAQGNRVAGIGVQFNDMSGDRVRDKIETYLARMLTSKKPTQTM